MKRPFFGRDIKTAPAEITIFVPPDVLFPRTEATAAALLEILPTLSRDDTLFHCARVNILASGPGDFDVKGRQERLLQLFCTPEEIAKINAFARAHPGAGAPIVFFRGQILELMRWVAKHCINLPGDGNTYSDPSARRRFLKAALIASQLWSKRVYGGRLRLDEDVEISRQRALGAFRKAIEESGLAPHVGTTLGRGVMLFNTYFPREYPTFHEDFRKATRLTLDQYMICVAALGIYMAPNRPEGALFTAQTVAAATAYRDHFPQYLDLEAQTPGRLAGTLWDRFDRDGYKLLRERPVMVVQDGRCIILDPTCFSERISIGPLFYLLRGVDAKKANQVFSAFGVAFERYAADILRRVYPARPGLVDRLDFSVPGVNGSGRSFEIDAVLNDATEAAIFEMKAAWLREDTMLGENYETFINHIRSKYGASLDGSERDKGVAQLTRIVGAIARREWLGRAGEFAQVRTLYPVLLVHDARLDAPALGNFLVQEFNSLIGATPPGRVAPLTVMTINDLEDLESSLGEFSMCALLRDYTRECPDRVRSLHNFISFSEYGPKIRPSAELVRNSAALLELAQNELFPEIVPRPA